jgi:hypothetical protein
LRDFGRGSAAAVMFLLLQFNHIKYDAISLLRDFYLVEEKKSYCFQSSNEGDSEDEIMELEKSLNSISLQVVIILVRHL